MCHAKYTVEKRAEGYFFALTDGAVECQECRTQIVLPLASLTKGTTVACRKCPARYSVEVVRCDIRLDKVPENGSVVPSGIRLRDKLLLCCSELYGAT